MLQAKRPALLEQGHEIDRSRAPVGTAAAPHARTGLRIRPVCREEPRRRPWRRGVRRLVDPPQLSARGNRVLAWPLVPPHAVAAAHPHRTLAALTQQLQFQRPRARRIAQHVAQRYAAFRGANNPPVSQITSAAAHATAAVINRVMVRSPSRLSKIRRGGRLSE